MIYYIIEFIIIGVISYFAYYYFFMKRSKKKPIEFYYLETKYNLDFKKIGTKRFKKIISLYNSLVISLTIVTLEFFNNLGLKMIVGFLLVMVLTLGIYYFIGKYYQKKGMTK